MGAIISLLIIASVSLLIVRIGSTALMMTGLSRDVAGFQAYSAFFGVGFTTKEAELVVNSPHRRRIIKHLILAGNLGLTAGLASVIVAFVRADGVREEMRVLFSILGGLLVVSIVALTPPMRTLIDWAIRRSLQQAGVVHAADYSLLLRLHAGFTVSEVEVGTGSTLVGRTLSECKLGSLGVIVLGISRRDPSGHEHYIHTPHGATQIHAHDVLTVYGKPDRIRETMH